MDNLQFVAQTDPELAAVMQQELAREIDIPIVTGGRVRRLEDVKKYLYAGAKAVFLDGSDMDNVDLIKEAADRFGDEKIYVYLPSPVSLAGCRNLSSWEHP